MSIDVQWANFWVGVILAVITLLAVSVALFRQWFWNLVNKPKVGFKIGNKEPHRIQGKMSNGKPIWYFRLELKNIGKTVAKNCYIKINSVLSEDGRPIEYFEPDTLKWSNAPRDMGYRINPIKDINDVDKNQLTPIFRESKDISPNGGWEFCDLFEARGYGDFTFISRGNRPSYMIKDGNYIVEIEIFGDNIEPRKKKFKLYSIKDFPLVGIDWA